MNINQFKEELAKKNINLTDYQLSQFENYYQMLVEWNEKMNLTAITKKEEVYEKHFYDSLTVAFDFEFNNQTLCDVGAGAGFPSIPLKIVYPDLKITIVDSLAKRITFLNELCKQLELTNVKAVASRAEEFAGNNRETFDIVTGRAVARLNILDELCIPLLKVGGHFITLKGQQGLEELKEASKGIEILGCELLKHTELELVNEQAKRVNIYYLKTKKTPLKYPRQFGQIKKKPL